MNIHFTDHNDRHEIPKTTFGRLDHVVVPLDDGGTVLLAFDLIDADWLEKQGNENPLFALSNFDRLATAWKNYRKDIVHTTREVNPFEHAPLFRLELEIQSGESLDNFNTWSENLLMRWESAESNWLSFDISHSQNGGQRANLYATLFGRPISVYVNGSMPDIALGTALSTIFSLEDLPVISTNDLEALLSGSQSNYLAIYDVGQGNANALLDKDYLPTLYYDLGAGVYRNALTKPNDLRFCFSKKPIILLSHWDADHWAGAYAIAVDGSYPALERTWIAPCQKVGPLHIAFAYEIFRNGGQLLTYCTQTGAAGATKLSNGHNLKFILGNGKRYDRNDTGIVMAVENMNLDPKRSWLLTGDCDYRYFMNNLTQLPPVAMVAPHHGATINSATVPRPIENVNYKRLIYSFGHNNLHGSTNVRHPTKDGVIAHSNAGWWHATWNPLTPGCGDPGGNVLATNDHSSIANRGGALVGWDTAPTILTAPCGGCCTVSPVQT